MVLGHLRVEWWSSLGPLYIRDQHLIGYYYPGDWAQYTAVRHTIFITITRNRRYDSHPVMSSGATSWHVSAHHTADLNIVWWGWCQDSDSRWWGRLGFGTWLTLYVPSCFEEVWSIFAWFHDTDVDHESDVGDWTPHCRKISTCGLFQYPIKFI